MYDIQTLVNLLVAVASGDQTEPPCWRTNEVIGGIERLVMLGRKDYAGFEEIAKKAYEATGDDKRHEKALLLLARVNGARRQDAVEVSYVLGLFGEAKAQIEALPDGPRKERCRSFLKYQNDTYTATNGLYAEASVDSAADATDQNIAPDKRAIAGWNAMVYGAYDAVVRGDTTGTRTAIDTLEGDLPGFAERMQGSADGERYIHGNASCDLLLIAQLVATDGAPVVWGPHLDDLRAHAARLGKIYEDHLALAEAAEMFFQGKSVEARDAATAIMNDPLATAQVKAIARLTIARASRDLGDSEAAKKAYRDIVPAQDCHMIVAVAAREIASLP